MGVLLGLAVALAYGSADFCGGFASRRSTAGATVLTSQAAGLLVAAALTALLGDPLPAARDLLLSAGAGLTGVAGVACLYRGLAVGRMSVVAPLSAVGAAVLQVTWGLGRGERPGGVALTGGVLAVAAVYLVTRGGEGDRSDTELTSGTAAARATEVALAAGAALGFAAAFVCFAETAESSGMWPVLGARLAAVPATLLVLVSGRRPLVPARDDRGYVVGAGLFDITANALLLAAVRRELVTLVAPVAALYPGATVVLARFVLGERIGPVRLAGLALALAGLALIAGR